MPGFYLFSDILNLLSDCLLGRNDVSKSMSPSEVRNFVMGQFFRLKTSPTSDASGWQRTAFQFNQTMKVPEQQKNSVSMDGRISNEGLRKDYPQNPMQK